MKLNYNKKYAMFPLSKTVILSRGVERQSNGDQQKDKWSMWEEPGFKFIMTSEYEKNSREFV